MDDMLSIQGVVIDHGITLSSSREESAEQSVHDSGFECVQTPDEQSIRTRADVFGVLQCLTHRMGKYRWAVRRVARAVERRIVGIRPKLLWLILDSTAVIDVCYLLSRRNAIPFVAQIWDDVDYLTRQRRLNRWTRASLRSRTDVLLKGARRVGVISENMRDAYRTRLGVDSIVVRQAVQEQAVEQPADSEFLRIGFCGAMYCHQAWKSFQLALDSLGWQVNGRVVELYVLGSDIRFQSMNRANCRFAGYRSAEESLAAMSTCDLLYLPQPFDQLQRELAELSFPTKFSTYLAAGRPIFVHGPEYASVIQFCRSNSVGVICCKLEPSQIADRIHGFLDSEKSWAEQAEAVYRVRRQFFARENFERQVKELLGCH